MVLLLSAVLNPDDVSFTDDERAALQTSLASYRADLLGALKNYPAGRPPGSDAEKIYHAALLLSVGEVEKTESELASLSGSNALAGSLRVLIAAVKRAPLKPADDPHTATGLLAASYFEQSRATGDESLQSALDLAQRAAKSAPGFGFAWERVAELQFGFGRTREAETALDQALKLSPQNAQALALKGFLLAAQIKSVTRSLVQSRHCRRRRAGQRLAPDAVFAASGAAMPRATGLGIC